AIVLSIIPIPALLEYARPLWSLLFVIFWMIMAPEKVGLFTAWSIGLFMDILTGSAPGQQALAVLLSSLLIAGMHNRIYRVIFPEQCLFVMYAIIIFQLTYLWVGIITEKIHFNFFYFIPIGTSIIIWPVVFFILDKFCCIYSTKSFTSQ
ncbi:MAG: rod shape-determining protein MreD, partial [Endozoicomonadaceae bacterium]|nr:rod shape-determining protein MreD [Endozoicomonadaceae bacterium]